MIFIILIGALVVILLITITRRPKDRRPEHPESFTLKIFPYVYGGKHEEENQLKAAMESHINTNKDRRRRNLPTLPRSAPSRRAVDMLKDVQERNPELMDELRRMEDDEL